MPFDILKDIRVEEGTKDSLPSTKVDPILQTYPIMDYFGIDSGERQDQDVQGIVCDIYEWLRQEKPKATAGDVMVTLKKLEGRLGAPNPGVRRYQHVYNWIKLSAQINDLEKQRSVYERTNR
jgi:hypothetical protein